MYGVNKFFEVKVKIARTKNSSALTSDQLTLPEITLFEK